LYVVVVDLLVDQVVVVLLEVLYVVVVLLDVLQVVAVEVENEPVVFFNQKSFLHKNLNIIDCFS